MNMHFTEINLNDDFLEPSQKTIDEVNAKIEECYRILENRYERKLRRPIVKYDLEGHVAGYAIGAHTIRLNLGLIRTHRDDMINNTLPHEVAHIVTTQVYPGAKPHGSHWAHVMFLLGLNADRCHQYETVAARKRSKPYRYECGCSEAHYVTKTIHNRIQKGRVYTCRNCGKVLH